MRQAQQGGFQVEEISSASGTAIPIKIALPPDLPQPDVGGQGPMFLMFRGLPLEIALSAGFRMGDAWAVSLRDVPDLTMSSPPNYQGSYMLTVTLHKGQNAKPESHTILVRLAPGASPGGGVASKSPVPTAAVAAPTAEPEAEPAAIADTVNRLSEGEQATLLENATELLGSGDIEAARLVYLELAANGSGKAAFLMARTFDPQMLEEHFVVGMQPDAERARQWYARAAELGDSEARERLRTLPHLQ